MVLVSGFTAHGADPAPNELRAQRCGKTAKLTIYQALRSGDSTSYQFCDGSTVLKRADGSMGISLALPSDTPAYKAFVEEARATLEVADHNAKVLQTQTARDRAAAAQAAYERRVVAFMKKSRISKETYYAAVKKSAVKVEVEVE